MKNASEKNIVLKKSCPGNISIRNNREFIERILENLVSNAIKYTGENGRIIISCTLEGDDKERILELNVSDTGIGINEKDMEHISNYLYSI